MKTIGKILVLSVLGMVALVTVVYMFGLNQPTIRYGSSIVEGYTVFQIEMPSEKGTVDDVIVNDGNCPIERFKKADQRKLRAYAEKYPDLVVNSEQHSNFIEKMNGYVFDKLNGKYDLFNGGAQISDTATGSNSKYLVVLNAKNGEKVPFFDIKYKTKEADEFFDLLSDDSRALYVDVFPSNSVQIVVKCYKDELKKMVVKTSNGDFDYDLSKIR